MNYNRENCGWSEIVGSPIMCNYNGHRTWRDECCETWKPKEKETNMIEVVRCKDCKFRQSRVSRIIDGKECNLCEMVKGYKPADWFCADGKPKKDVNE